MNSPETGDVWFKVKAIEVVLTNSVVVLTDSVLVLTYSILVRTNSMIVLTIEAPSSGGAVPAHLLLKLRLAVLVCRTLAQRARALCPVTEQSFISTYIYIYR